MTEQKEPVTRPFIVSVLRFDCESDVRLQAVTRRIRTSIGFSEAPDLYPHVSLIPTDCADRDGVVARLFEGLADQSAVEIVFSHLGLFPGGVLFLGATPTAELISLHQRVFEVSSPDSTTPWIDLYKPQRWVPHCTLAMGVSHGSLERAVAAAYEGMSFPIVGTCESIELLEIQSGQPPKSVGSMLLRTG